MGNLLQDLRFAIRNFRKSPGFVVTAVLSLTLAIGATTAIFSVVYGVLVDPYPYKDADRMVHVELQDKEGRGPLIFVNAAGYRELLQVASVDDVFLQRSEPRTLTGDGVPISVEVGTYSPNLFEYMGVAPILGRTFTRTDAPGGNPAPLAVLSHAFWQRQYGGDPQVIGRTLKLHESAFTVIGVVPPRFTWGDSDVYLPGVPTADAREYWQAFIKLKPGMPFARAESELQAVVNGLAKLDPGYPQERRVKIVTLNELVLGRFAGTIVFLFASVITLLIIGCANVSILLLARGMARQHEFAVRTSIGAGRGRLIRQMLTESLLLSVTGAVLGAVLAHRGVGAIAAMLPLYSFPHEAAIHVNWPVLAFSAGVAVLTGLLFGLSPAWQLSRPQIATVMQSSSARHTGGTRARRVHRVLVAGQVALTLLLLAGAGAATRGFLERLRTPLGFDPDRVVAMTVAFPRGANANWEARLNAQEGVREAVTRVPGVEAASVSTTWFPPFGGFTAAIEVLGRSVPAGSQAMLGLVGADEFRVLRIPVLKGRTFDQGEVMRAAHLAVVNRAFVDAYLRDVDPIGQRVRGVGLPLDQPTLMIAAAPHEWLEVVGVVADARNDGIDRPARPAVFLPHSFVIPPDVSLIVRTTVAPESVSASIKETLRRVNSQAVVTRERSFVWWLETEGWGQQRFVARLFAVFAVLALVLAATGLFSVVSYGVTQRTREVGTRMALGARPGSIVALVLGSTATMLVIGVTAGIALSAALDGVVASWAGGSSRDPLTLTAAAGVLLVVALTACVLPAWRAATLDPLRAMRTD